jgi:hypothetical protein
MVTICRADLCLHIGLCAYIGLVGNHASANPYQIMTRILDQYHLDNMLEALRGAVRPGVLSFQIDADTVHVSGAKNGKFVLRAIRKNATHWIISHPEALFSPVVPQSMDELYASEFPRK